MGFEALISHRVEGGPSSQPHLAGAGGERTVSSPSPAPAPGGLLPQAFGRLKGEAPPSNWGPWDAPTLPAAPAPQGAPVCFQRRDPCHGLKTSRAPWPLAVDPKLLTLGPSPPWGLPLHPGSTTRLQATVKATSFPFLSMNLLPQDPPPGRPTPEDSGGLGPFWVLTPLLHTGLWVPAPPSPTGPTGAGGLARSLSWAAGTQKVKSRWELSLWALLSRCPSAQPDVSGTRAWPG